MHHLESSLSSIPLMSLLIAMVLIQTSMISDFLILLKCERMD
jgi:hypothetical protein